MCVDDELIQARAKVAELKARITTSDDEEDREYLRLVIVRWDQYIARLEARHEALQPST